VNARQTREDSLRGVRIERTIGISAGSSTTGAILGACCRPSPLSESLVSVSTSTQLAQLNQNARPLGRLRNLDEYPRDFR
jgi:hypothetical protein